MQKVAQRILFTLVGLFGYYALVVDKPYQPKQILLTRKGYEGRD